jgi:hypothetical protein
MSRKSIIDLVENQPTRFRHRAFLASTNGEIRRQLKICGWSETAIDNLIRSELLVGSLLSDLIVQPSSHYYEPETRSMMLNHRQLFNEGLGIFVLGENVASFKQDAEQKRIEYPSKESAYRNEQHLRKSVEELESFGSNIHREGSIGNLTGTIWRDGLSIAPNAEGADRIWGIKNCSALSEKDKTKLIDMLPTLPQLREGLAFDWDFVYSKITESGIQLSNELSLGIRRLLLRCYLSACSQLYSGNIITSSRAESALYPSRIGIEVFDISLFIDFAHILGIGEIVPDLNASDIIDINLNP